MRKYISICALLLVPFLSISTIPGKIVAVGAMSTVVLTSSGCSKIGQRLLAAFARGSTRRAASKIPKKVRANKTMANKPKLEKQYRKSTAKNVAKTIGAVGGGTTIGITMAKPMEAVAKVPGEVAKEVLIMKPLTRTAQRLSKDQESTKSD